MNRFDPQALTELREAMARLDATITHHADMTDAPDRPPTGEDYNALFDLVERWLDRMAQVETPPTGAEVVAERAAARKAFAVSGFTDWSAFWKGWQARALR